jgi:hypothetical protein
MSTTIDVIPVSTMEITFGDVLAKATGRINERLAALGLAGHVDLQVNVHKRDESVVREVAAPDLFVWTDDEYAWFSIKGIAGGTDAYMDALERADIESDEPWWYIRYISEYNTDIPDLAERLEQAKLVNKRISFRRSMGQPGIIALSYGLIAASVAELTNGILWSDDGAWSIKRFPADHKGFFDWYFVPELALRDDDRDWAERCLAGIPEDLLEASSVKGERPWWKLW